MNYCLDAGFYFKFSKEIMMNEFLFGVDSSLPLGITVVLIVIAWVSILSVVIVGVFN